MQQSDTNVFHLPRVMELSGDETYHQVEQGGLRSTCINTRRHADVYMSRGTHKYGSRTAHTTSLSLSRPAASSLALAVCLVLLLWLMKGNYPVCSEELHKFGSKRWIFIMMSCVSQRLLSIAGPYRWFAHCSGEIHISDAHDALLANCVRCTVYMVIFW